MTDGATPGGDALALEIGRATQRRVARHDHRRAIGIGLVHGDGLDRRASGQGEQQRAIADDAGVHRAGIERLGQGRGGGKFRPLDPITWQVAQAVGGLQLGAHVALLVGDEQSQGLGGQGRGGGEQQR